MTLGFDIMLSEKRWFSLYAWQVCPSTQWVSQLVLDSLTLIVSFCAWAGDGGSGGLVAESCPTLWDPMDCRPPGSSVHGIPQARIVEWVAISSSRGSSSPRDRTQVSCISCTDREILYHWATGEALFHFSSIYVIPFQIKMKRGLYSTVIWSE